MGKIPIAVGLVVASIGLGFGEARRVAHWENKIAALAEQRGPILEQLRQLRYELSETTNQLTAAREDNDRLRANVLAQNVQPVSQVGAPSFLKLFASMVVQLNRPKARGVESY